MRHRRSLDKYLSMRYKYLERGNMRGTLYYNFIRDRMAATLLLR